MIIVPTNVSRKDPVVYGGAASSYAGSGGYANASLYLGAPVGATILYTAGSYQNDTTISAAYAGQAITHYGNSASYGSLIFKGLTNVSNSGTSITTTATSSSGYGHAAAWFVGAASVTALTGIDTTSANITVSCAEGEILVALTAIPVGAVLSGGTLVTKTDYYSTSQYGGGAVRIAAGPTTTTFTQSTNWGMGTLVVVLKP